LKNSFNRQKDWVTSFEYAHEGGLVGWYGTTV